MTNGDLICCLNCGNVFKDTMPQYEIRKNPKNFKTWTDSDSRYNPKVHEMCYKCGGTKTINTARVLAEKDQYPLDVVEYVETCITKHLNRMSTNSIRAEE